MNAYYALKVIAETPAIRGWLEANDPMALRQVRDAIVEIEEEECPTCLDEGWILVEREKPYAEIVEIRVVCPDCQDRREP